MLFYTRKILYNLCLFLYQIAFYAICLHNVNCHFVSYFPDYLYLCSE